MDIQKERKLFQDFLIENFDFEHHEQTYFDEKTQCYENDHGEDTEVVNIAWSAWQAAKAQATPEGFVLVPKEATKEMIKHGYEAHDCFFTLGSVRNVWDAMIEAREQGHD